MPGGAVAGEGSSEPRRLLRRRGRRSEPAARPNVSTANALDRDAAAGRLFLTFCPLAPGLERSVPILDQFFVER